MKSILLLLLAGLLMLTGCAHGYVITLNNGSQIRARNKPHLVNGFYYYKDVSGRDGEPVFSGRVSEIAPASMATEKKKTFKPSPTH